LDDLKLTIGKVAKLAGVSVETIRYYERFGIISKPTKCHHSYRQYPKDIVQRVRFIKGAQELRFKLSEISDLLSMRLNVKSTPEALRAVAGLKIKQIDEKIHELHRIRSALVMAMDCCEAQVSSQNCPVLDRFYESESADAFGFIEKLNDAGQSLAKI
jgi:MerR family mercuric resistance operon transcriptional regulator